MSGAEVKVLSSWISPFSARVEVALKLKGIPYELVDQDVMSKSPELLKYNPIHKKIPVFFHNGKPICESQIIIQYIDETWKHNPILPQDPYDRAVARFWADLVDTKFVEAIKVIMLATEEEEILKEAKKLEEVLQLLEGELKVKGQKFFGGDEFGFLDIVLCWLNTWILAVHELIGAKIYEPQDLPLLEKWMEDILEIPVFKESLAPKEKVVQFYREVRGVLLASAAPK